MNLNKAMLIGNLTRDPEVRQTPTGLPVASFGVATNYTWLDKNGQKQEKADFHNIVAWRKLAEICGKYLHKGSKIYVEGRIQTRDWLDKDNIKRYMTEIVADNLIMLDSKPGGSTGGGSYAPSGYDQPTPAGEPTINYDEPVGNDNGGNSNANAAAGEDDIVVENIPF